VQAFEEPPQITRIPSWETEPGESGMHPADLGMDPAAAQAVLQQFVALGYIQPPSEDQARAAETALREQQYNLARVYLNSQRIAEAQTIFEQLTIKWPDESRFLQHFAQCALAQGHHEQAKTLLHQLIAFKPKAAPARKSDPLTATERPGPANAATNSQPRAWVALLMGTIHFEEGDLDAALACLQRAEQSDSHLPDLHLRVGETYLRQKRTHDAERAFQRALEIDGDCAEAHLGLALVHLRQRHNENAAERALLAVGLQHFLPLGHFYLGIALARLGHHDRAVLAFETSLTMHPGLIAAHRWLAALYTRPGGDLGKAVRHREILLRIRRRRQLQAEKG
jgi:tetratricopeptide (TPR) repeat protein